MSEREYKLDIDPRILELLGPSLYTNIYYILAELIANAYDADANNVYIITRDNSIIVEDDGKGMSYSKGEVDKYLKVANISRNYEGDEYTKLGRLKMGRKGVGKLAALSVSDKVIIKTISNNEKSGFVLSRQIQEDKVIKALDDKEIIFDYILDHGTSVVMHTPQYKLNSSPSSIKRNLLKIFPLVNHDFKIHLVTPKEKFTISDFDKEMIEQLSTLITLGDDFKHLSNIFKPVDESLLLKTLKTKISNIKVISMTNKSGITKEYELKINGWIGTYLSTKGRKAETTDFPDNFISLYANKKVGEFNILPIVGQNKLNEVYVVGQLHVDIFELTELPDMALSNRQGYKSDDLRYETVISFVRNELLPEISRMRDSVVSFKKSTKENTKLDRQKKNEELFRQAVDNFRNQTVKNTSDKISKMLNSNKDDIDKISKIISDEVNSNSNQLGIKSIIDSSKKKILISQTARDKDLADIVYYMLLFNNVPAQDILYTNCDDEISRIPEGDIGKSGVYDYLRDFFVNSYSTQKMYVLFVTSQNTKTSWGALTEVGAAWITQVEHKIFNIHDFRPEHPLDDSQQWHTSFRDEKGELFMYKLGADIMAQKIEYICDKLGYIKRTRDENKRHIESLIKIIN